jgi:hypothetical protein
VLEERFDPPLEQVVDRPEAVGVGAASSPSRCRSNRRSISAARRFASVFVAAAEETSRRRGRMPDRSGSGPLSAGTAAGRTRRAGRPRSGLLSGTGGVVCVPKNVRLACRRLLCMCHRGTSRPFQSEWDPRCDLLPGAVPINSEERAGEVVVGPHPNDEVALHDPAEHLPVQQKRQAAEHHLLLDVRSRCEGATNPIGQFAIVRHPFRLRRRTADRSRRSV